MLSVWDVVRESVETDIDASVGAILARRLVQTRKQIESHVLSDDLLINPPIQYRYDNLYVFIPKAGNWEEVHSWIEDVLPRN
jgi:hypothetical protein